MELLGKKEAELKDLGNSQPIHTARKMKKRSGMKTLRVWPNDHLSDKEMSMNQSFQHKPRALLLDNERKTPRQIRNHQGCLLGFKVGNHGHFFLRD